MALTLHYHIMLRKITSKLMIKVVEFVVKGSRLPANTINGNDMQTLRTSRIHAKYGTQLLHMKPVRCTLLHCVLFVNKFNRTYSIVMGDGLGPGAGGRGNDV